MKSTNQLKPPQKECNTTTTAARPAHTPGPWHVREHDDQDTRAIWARMTALGPIDVATCFKDDAALIAAAPEMLAALGHFVEWHANNFDDFSSDVNAQLLCLANDAAAAIAKAKGGAE